MIRKERIRNEKRWLAVLAAFCLFCTLFLSSLPSAFPQEKKEKDISYDVEVSAITIAVTVQDGKGRFINDLSQEDFSIFENDEKRDLTYFQHDFEAPLSLTILLDVSGSMDLQDKLKESKEALRHLIKYVFPDRDEFSLLIFADGDVEVASKFTKNKAHLLSILDQTEAYGKTALNDAVAVSPEFANKGSNEKRALLLITDGIETDSQYSHEQAIEIARRVDIPIYTIAYKIPLSAQFLKKYKHSPALTPSNIIYSLDKFSKATGGEAYFINTVNEMRSAFRQIKKELSHYYILGYTSHTNTSQEYRKIKVTTSSKRHKVRTREGYYSGEK
jgi:Ca-activated chloride channel family protein